MLVAVFAAEAWIGVMAHQAGEKNFVPTDETTIEIQVQTIGTAERRRALQVVYLAAQVAAAIVANSPRRLKLVNPEDFEERK